MFHTCAVTWKQKVRYFLYMHLHICFKWKYLFSQCISTCSRAQHKTFHESFMHELWMQQVLAETFRRETEHRNKCTCHTKITKKISKCYQITSENTYEHILYVYEALHLLWTYYNMKLMFITNTAANIMRVNLSDPFHSACVLVDSICSSSHWFLRSAVMLIISSHLGLLFI